MPQLKIQDVKDDLDNTKAELDDKFSSLVEEVKIVLAEAGVGTDSGESVTATDSMDVIELRKDVAELKDAIVGHINLYNNHIIQQHNKKK
tara:strand:+ start:115 stop:384 length:270 start_codon:yes stop_codon:yes gene_type:complete